MENKSANDLIRHRLLGMFDDHASWYKFLHLTEDDYSEIIPQIMSIIEDYQKIITGLELRCEQYKDQLEVTIARMKNIIKLSDPYLNQTEELYKTKCGL